MEYRYSVFVENMKKIEAHNQKKSTYTMGVNAFTDLTWEEFKKGYLAEAIPNTTFNPNGEKLKDVDHIDWRQHDAVTPVKN